MVSFCFSKKLAIFQSDCFHIQTLVGYPSFLRPVSIPTNAINPFKSAYLHSSVELESSAHSRVHLLACEIFEQVEDPFSLQIASDKLKRRQQNQLIKMRAMELESYLKSPEKGLQVFLDRLSHEEDSEILFEVTKKWLDINPEKCLQYAHFSLQFSLQQRLELAEKCIEKSCQIFLFYFDSFLITHPDHHLHLARLILDRGYAGLCNYFDYFVIEQLSDRVEIFTKALYLWPSVAIQNFFRFRIQDSQYILDLACRALSLNSSWTLSHLKNFRIRSDKDRFFLAQKALKLCFYEAARNFSCFEITDSALRFEIALFCARKDPDLVYDIIEEFALDCDEHRVAISIACLESYHFDGIHDQTPIQANFLITQPDYLQTLDSAIALLKPKYLPFYLSRHPDRDDDEKLKAIASFNLFFNSQLEGPELIRFLKLEFEQLCGYFSSWAIFYPQYTHFSQAIQSLDDKSEPTSSLQAYVGLMGMALHLIDPDLFFDHFHLWIKLSEHKNTERVSQLFKILILDLMPVLGQKQALEALDRTAHQTSPLYLVSLPLINWAKTCLDNPHLSALSQLLLSFKKGIKDKTTQLEELLLRTFLTIDKTPFLKPLQKLKLAHDLLDLNDAEPIDALLVRLQCCQTLLGYDLTDWIENLPSKNLTDHLSTLVAQSLRSDPFLDVKDIDQLEGRYHATFGSMRQAYAIKVYQTACEQAKSPPIREAFNSFFRQVLENRFLSERYLPNCEHNKKIADFSSEIWQSWQTNASEEHSLYASDKKQPAMKLIVAETDCYEDLLLCGTDIEGSCMSVFANISLNKALLGYLLDGKNKMIAIKKPHGGRILARCMFKLLWNETDNAPVLFLESIYPQKKSNHFIPLIEAFAKKRAQQMGCQVFKKEFSFKTCYEKKYELTALRGVAPFDYSDGGFERIVEGGCYKVTGATLL